jgi:hypothetical protein
MKKIQILLFALCLILMASANTLAAVHNFTGDFSNPFLWGQSYLNSFRTFEGWYYIEKDRPSATVRSSFSESRNVFGAEYFQNDQMFIDIVGYHSDSGSDITLLNGSYLWDNGIFFGLEYINNSSAHQTILSPGYRFSFQNDSYLALNADYSLEDDAAYRNSGVIDYVISGKYYTDRSRLYGEINIPNQDVIGVNQPYFWAGGAVKVSESVVLGANIGHYDTQNYYELGATCSFDKLGVEFNYDYVNGYYSDQYAVDLNTLYSFTDTLRAGVQVTKVQDIDDPYIYAKASYQINNQNSLKFIYGMKNSSAGSDAVSYLYWDFSI